MTGRCNCRCCFCFFSNSKETGIERDSFSSSELSKESLLKIIDGITECDIRSVTLVGGGESTIHPDFAWFISMLNLEEVSWGLITNGYKEFSVDEIAEMRKAKWIRVSVDSACQETYSKVHRPVDEYEYGFDRLKKNIEKFINNGCEVGISFLVLPINASEIFAAYDMFRQLGCSYIQFKPPVMKDRGKIIEEIKPIIDEQFAKISESQKHYKNFTVYNMMTRNKILLEPRRMNKPCHLIRFRNQIASNGHVYPCCVTKYKKEYSYGSLDENSLKNILDGTARSRINKSLIPVHCEPCWDDEFNEVVDYFSGNKPDSEFI